MQYISLKKQIFEDGVYAIVPLRDEDKMLIMKWRNEQIYHLRQQNPLTITEQENYFKNVVSGLFTNPAPQQLLFSFLENGICIGYGGLVHINRTDRHAEISFIMDTRLENDFFQEHWKTYLGLIEQLAFDELGLHKIFTYAFDLRPELYVILDKCGYTNEAKLSDHAFFDGKYIDVLIHTKINSLA